MSPKAEPSRFSKPVSVSIPLPPVFCGPAMTRLTVTLDGVTITPALALGGWLAFKPMHGGAMVMGDLVLLESEINPVMLKMIQGGLDITAVHNHLLRASPATFYMHTWVGTATPPRWPR